MKKIIILGIIFLFPLTTHAYAPIMNSDLIIGKVDSIIFSDSLQLQLENFVNYRIIDEIGVIMRRNTSVNSYMTIEHYPSDIDIQSGDVVAIESSGDTYSYGIFKITCSVDGTSNVVGTVDKLFGTGLDTTFKNDIDLANKIDATIGCENLASFLKTDRRLQDLDGKHALYDLYKVFSIKDYIKIFTILGSIVGFIMFILYIQRKRKTKK